MSRPKKEKINNDAVENPNERFKRIANFRLKKLRYELGRIEKMTNQPNYTIYDVDAQKIIDTLKPMFDNFLNSYQPIADGKTKITQKTEQENIL